MSIIKIYLIFLFQHSSSYLVLSYLQQLIKKFIYHYRFLVIHFPRDIRGMLLILHLTPIPKIPHWIFTFSLMYLAIFFIFTIHSI